MSEETPQRQHETLRPVCIGVFWFAALLTATAVFTGCVTVPQTGFPWSVSDPPALSPYAQSLNAPGRESVQYGAARLGEPTIAAEPEPAATPGGRLHRRLEAPDPSPGGAADSAPFPDQPPPQRVVPDDSSSRPQLALLADVPESVAVDEFVPVRLNIRNATAIDAENVAVTCRFDDGLSFPGASEQAVRQKLGRLASGDNRELVLSLSSRQVGRCCLQLQVSSDTHADTSTEKCLQITPKQSVDVSIVGPRRRTRGSRAEYVVTLINTSGADLPAAEAAISYDPALVLKEVSAGAEREAGRLRWDLGTFLNDERIQIQVEFECQSILDARLAVTVNSNDRPAGHAEARLDVTDRPELELRLSDAADPLEVGASSTFVLDVENHSSQPVAGIVVHLIPSGIIHVDSAQVRQDAREINLNAFLEGQGLYFEAAPPLAPGAGMTYEIQFTARAAGTGELRALLQSKTLPTPLEVQEPIVINPPRTSD